MDWCDSGSVSSRSLLCKLDPVGKRLKKFGLKVKGSISLPFSHFVCTYYVHFERLPKLFDCLSRFILSIHIFDADFRCRGLQSLLRLPLIRNFVDFLCCGPQHAVWSFESKVLNPNCITFKCTDHNTAGPSQAVDEFEFGCLLLSIVTFDWPQAFDWLLLSFFVASWALFASGVQRLHSNQANEF